MDDYEVYTLSRAEELAAVQALNILDNYKAVWQLAVLARENEESPRDFLRALLEREFDKAHP